MKFHGFRSIEEYERECIRCGMCTLRIPFIKDKERYFVLITDLIRPSPTSIATWHLFSADEQQEFMDGVINGHPANFLSKLAAHGYYPSVEVPERYRQ